MKKLAATLLALVFVGGLLAENADARGRRGGGRRSHHSRSYSYSFSSYTPSHSTYKPKRKYKRTYSRSSSRYYVPTTAVGVAGLGAIGATALANGSDLYVIANSLNLRSTASTSSAVLTRLTYGTGLKKQGSTGPFIKVQAPNGKVGFVHASYVSSVRP